jgi:hypothetical protein
MIDRSPLLSFCVLARGGVDQARFDLSVRTLAISMSVEEVALPEKAAEHVIWSAHTIGSLRRPIDRCTTDYRTFPEHIPCFK